MSFIMQNLNNVNGLTKEFFNKLSSFENYEELTQKDVEELVQLEQHPQLGKYIKSMLFNNDLEVPEIAGIIDLLNLKRYFKYYLDGNEYYIVIPSKRNISSGILNNMNSLLLKVARAYYQYTHCEIEDKEKFLDLFMNLKHKLILAIETNVFSKEFKNMYQMVFSGITGVALTGNVSINGIQIPEWYARENKINIGDIGIVFRDPVQNLITALKVEGFTSNEMRVHSLIFTWLNGDHDGDKVQFIPLKNFLKQNEEYTDEFTLDIIKEVNDLLPSRLLEHKKFMPLLQNADLDITPKAFSTPHTMLEMLEESEKSLKYSGAIDEQDYINNQASTILNMRTVKEGTAFAGAFANWIFEKSRIHNYDMCLARHLGDLIQQEALDSKHTTGGKGFMDSQWYKITDLKNKCYQDTYDMILAKVNAILDEEPAEKDKNDYDFDDEFEF